MNIAESIIKIFEASADSCEASFYILFLMVMPMPNAHSELSYGYGLSIAPKLQRVGSIHIPGSDQPTPDPSFSHLYNIIYIASIIVILIDLDVNFQALVTVL